MPEVVTAAEQGAAETLDRAEARALTDRIQRSADYLWTLVIQAFRGRAWEALGYRTWRAYCESEFSISRLRLPAEERSAVVAQLANEGMSTRAIAAALGVGRSTVARTRAGVPDEPPDEVTGLDGKTYQRAPTAQKAIRHEEPASAPLPVPASGRRSADQVISNLVSNLRGMCQVIEGYDLDPALDRTQAALWASDLASSVAVLRRFTNTIKEFSRAEEAAGQVRNARKSSPLQARP